MPVPIKVTSTGATMSLVTSTMIHQLLLGINSRTCSVAATKPQTAPLTLNYTTIVEPHRVPKYKVAIPETPSAGLWPVPRVPHSVPGSDPLVAGEAIGPHKI